MFPTIPQLRGMLRRILLDKDRQGHAVAGLEARLASLPDRYDELVAFARNLADLPLRADWPYFEPSDWAGICAECDPERPQGALAPIDLADSARRVEAAFLGSVCGCVLGKPLEINPTLDELAKAFTAIGEWPLRDYISEKVRAQFDHLAPCWPETVRERIAYVAPDDDINYTILGMLLLEQHGREFTRPQLCELWLHSLPPRWTYGPERALLIKAAIDTFGLPSAAFDDWVLVLNPGDELCGAVIRADAYGYACPGRPQLAAELAWRDAGFTHRRTGIYGTMFVAAAIAAAQVLRDPLAVFRTALRYIPRRSRFHAIVADSLNDVAAAGDWLDGYRRIHGKYREYTHCQVYQEIGTLINTLRFATDVGDGICKQVMQGNDTDSFGATAGSLLGAFFGPGHLEDRWLRPFHDRLHTTVATLHEPSLGAVAARMAALPERVSGGLA